MSEGTRNRVVGGMVVGLLLLFAGCSGALVSNLTEEVDGENISIMIVNDTPFRAVFSFGTFSDLERDPPGNIIVQQQRIEGNTVLPTEISCQRDLAFGTDSMIERALENDFDDTDGFDTDAFSDVINFSAAPADDEAAGLPTAGFAEGFVLHLGNDYSCGDELIFTFVEAPGAPGGFDVTFELVADVDDG